MAMFFTFTDKKLFKLYAASKKDPMLAFYFIRSYLLLRCKGPVDFLGSFMICSFKLLITFETRTFAHKSAIQEKP